MPSRKRQAQDFNETDTTPQKDIEDVLDDRSLSISNTCRAAWGLAIMGVTTPVNKTFAGETTRDILMALSLRIRERLLGRLQVLRQGELRGERREDVMTLSEQLDTDAEALAIDAARSMWAFACVKACTGIRSVPLFETCCSVLLQNPTKLRERNQERQKMGLHG